MAAGERIAAQQGALKAGQEAVRSAKESIDGKMKVISGDIQQLASFWSGTAAQAFTTLMTQWGEETRKLNSVLVVLEDSLKSTEVAQAAIEEEHNSAAQNLVAQLNNRTQY
jgi:WXG100 family type VII secretion target